MSTPMTEAQTRAQIVTHKDNIHRKLKFQHELEEQKKDTAASYCAQIKAVKEDIEEELNAVEELESNLLSLQARILTAPAPLRQTAGGTV